MNGRAGFTVVELLIVIVVIGILAAITLVAFGGVRDRANDASIRSDLSSLAKQFEIFKVDNGRYPWSAAELLALDVSISKGAYLRAPDTSFNLVPCIADSGASYAIAAVSTSGRRLYISSSGGMQEYTGSGVWTGATPYATMCSNSLAGSSVISSGAGYGSDTWRTWTNG